MICAKLMGGLGNQMFQYALARKLAHKHHTEVALDTVFFENIAEVDVRREYELGCFELAEHCHAHSYTGKPDKLRNLKYKLKGWKWNIYKEPHYRFDPDVLRVPDNTYLIGFWQSEKYFADIRDILLHDFSFKTPAAGQNKHLLQKIRNTDAVSIHVRRGDYISNPHANSFHGTKDQSYYDAALGEILPLTDTPTLFVFSDEPGWCKNNLRFAYETVYVEGNTKGFEDMRLMSHCRHNIIANSSFSWWAAWLNTNVSKKVIAPKVWFNEPSTNTQDVIPSSWTQI